MKILIVTKYFYKEHPGGVETVNWEVAKRLKEKGHEVTLLATGNKNQEFTEQGVKVVTRKTLMNIGNGPINPGFFTEVMNRDYDVLHLNMPNPANNVLACRANSLSTRAPIAITYHADMPDYSNPALQFMKKTHLALTQRKILNKAASIMPTSPQYIDLSEQLPRYREKCTVVPNGVNPEEYQVEQGKRDKKKFVFAGRLIYYKGIQNLLKAFKKVLKEHPDAELKILGTGDKEEEWMELGEELSINDNIEWWRERYTDEEFKEECSDCTAFILPSTHKTEAFGVVLLEAMSCGAPVINTDVSGTEYVAEDAGEVVKTGDVDELAEAMNKLLDDPEKVKKMSEKSLEKVKNFSWKKITDKVEENYKEITEGA